MTFNEIFVLIWIVLIIFVFAGIFYNDWKKDQPIKEPPQKHCTKCGCINIYRMETSKTFFDEETGLAYATISYYWSCPQWDDDYRYAHYNLYANREAIIRVDEKGCSDG